MTLDPAEAARLLVGARFRPQGRSPELGLDCVGLIICAFRLPADQFRRDYRMRGNHERELVLELSKLFRRVPSRRKRAGDVLLLRVAGEQFHLGILTRAGMVHADARLGKIVEIPGTAPWPVVGVFRRRIRKQRQS